MNRSSILIFVSQDAGLVAHWQRAFGTGNQLVASTFGELISQTPSLESQIWLDLSAPAVPPWGHKDWATLTSPVTSRVIATTSNPKDNEAIAALDGGCVAYCHAFADVDTLRQVREVVQAGQIWIGKSLMQRLLNSALRASGTRQLHDNAWTENLTTRENEIAVLAANGASNSAIARNCGITERTVKAHLSAVFEKLNVTDRLQLALRVHGIN